MLDAPFRLIRRVVPHMYARGWGGIVNISAVHGLRASAFKAAYVAAKHGLDGLTKVVAAAAHGVTANCVNPAYVRTQLVEGQLAAQAATHSISESEVLEKIMLARSAIKRLIEPEEVAELVTSSVRQRRHSSRVRRSRLMVAGRHNDHGDGGSAGKNGSREYRRVPRAAHARGRSGGVRGSPGPARAAGVSGRRLIVHWRFSSPYDCTDYAARPPKIPSIMS